MLRTISAHENHIGEHVSWSLGVQSVGTNCGRDLLILERCIDKRF